MQPPEESTQPDYDSPWKDVLERYFEQFIEFFFPTMHQQIYWDNGYEFLDKELQQVVRDAELGRRLVDKLVKVWLENGEEAWVIVHIEVQGAFETDFRKRMYIYNYRVFDRYDKKVASLAVLADNSRKWRPTEYTYELFGCKVSLKFPIVKLLDYAGRVQELEQSSNPFAIIVHAFLKTRETAKAPEERFHWKITFSKMLYERGFFKKDILELIRFLDWIMILPEDLEQRFQQVLHEFEEEQRMRYMATFERDALEKGRLQGIEEGLARGMEQGMERGIERGIDRGRQEGAVQASQEAVLDIIQARFENVSHSITRKIRSEQHLALLKQMLRLAATVNSLEEFEEQLSSSQ